MDGKDNVRPLRTSDHHFDNEEDLRAWLDEHGAQPAALDPEWQAVIDEAREQHGWTS